MWRLHVQPAADVTTGAPLVDGQIATGIVAFDTNGEILSPARRPPCPPR
jgi:flagellar hook protein FlgE